MKIRQGFVSNSSSSSFVINRDDLTANQVKLIHNHVDIDKDQNMGFGWEDSDGDWWTIEETDFHLKGYVSMDNFDMCGFLEAIGVAEKHIKWEGVNR